MARATPTRSTDTPRDAVALLKSDHRQVEDLFERFEAADEDELGPIAERVCQLVTVHAQIEEEIFYPAARQAFGDEEEELELVNEAAVEHASVKELVAKIEAMTPEDETFKANVKVLSEYIKHHVKEEEKEMFPRLRQTELDTKELGAQLADRKLALMEEMGVEEEEPAPARSRSGRAGAKARARGRRESRTTGRAARH